MNRSSGPSPCDSICGLAETIIVDSTASVRLMPRHCRARMVETNRTDRPRERCVCGVVQQATSAGVELLVFVQQSES